MNKLNRNVPSFALILAVMAIWMVPRLVCADVIGDALGMPGQAWTNLSLDGGGVWTVDAVTTHDGVGAARSGTPPVGSQAQLETVLTGPGTVIFWAKARVPAGSYLVVDAAGINPLFIQEDRWRIYTVDVPAGPATLSFRFANWDASGAGGDAAWVDQVSFADYSAQPPALLGIPSSVTVDDGNGYIWWADVTGGWPFSGVWQHQGTDRFFADMNQNRLGVWFQARPEEAGDWRLIVTNAFGSVTSSVFTLTVNPSPPHALQLFDSFSSGRDPLPLAPGAAVALTVSATGTEPFTYQWQMGGFILGGETNPTLNFTSFSAAQNGVYTCVVRNSVGEAQSPSRTLVASLAPPTITLHSSSTALSAGEFLQLSITADGAVPLQFQWFKDGLELPGETHTDYIRNPAALEDSALYRVRVSNSGGTIWSDVITVTVDGGVALGEALELPLLAWSTVKGCDLGPGWLGQTNVTHDGSHAAGSVALSADQICTLDLQTEALGPIALGFWWKLEGAPADELRLDVLDEFLNVINSVTREGAAGAAWDKVSLSLPSGPNFLRWRLTSGNATDGVLPRAWLDQLLVQSLGEALETTNLVWTAGSDNPVEGWFYQETTTSDGVDAAQSPAMLAGGSAWLETVVTGPAFMEFKWFLTGDADARLTITQDGQAVPEGTINGSAGPVNFTKSSIAIPPGSHTLRWALLAGDQLGSPATAWVDHLQFSSNSALGAALDNITLAWGGPGWTEDADLRFTGDSAAKPPAIADNSTARLETAVAGPAAIRFDWRVDAQLGDFLRFYVDGVLVKEITGSSGSALQEVVAAVGAGVHFFRWAYEKDAAGAEGADAGWVDHVRIIPIEKPFLLHEPEDVVGLEGEPVGITVSAVSAEPMTYQWYRGAVPAGQSELLHFPVAQLGDAGSFFVVVANSFGSTTSRVAQLMVNPIPPVFSARLHPYWVYPRQNVHFQVLATGPRPLTYLWQFSTNGFATSSLIKSGSDSSHDLSSAGYEHSGEWRVVALDAISRASATTTAKVVVASRFYNIHPLTNGIPAGAEANAFGISPVLSIVLLEGGSEPSDSPTVIGSVVQNGKSAAYLFNTTGATPLGNLTETGRSSAYAMSRNGDVVGVATGPTGRGRAVRWEHVNAAGFGWPYPLPPVGKKPPQDLGLPPNMGDTEIEAVGINDRGQIAVNANIQTINAHYSFRWEDGNWQALQDREWNAGEYLGWTHAFGISSLGHIAGYSDGGFITHAWVFDPHHEPVNLWDELFLTDLHQRNNFSSDNYSRATDVNASGYVVGLRRPDRNGGYARAFLVAGKKRIDLNLFSNYSFAKLQINDYSEIIAQDFSLEPGGFARPMVIRDDGRGFCFSCESNSEHSFRAFVLEDLVLGGIGPFLRLESVSAINGFGSIAGTGFIPLAGVGRRPFVLVPADRYDNSPPAARNDTVTRFTDRVMVSFSELLLRNDTDPDLYEALSLLAYDTESINGGKVVAQGDWLTYTPNGGTGADQFNYTITDNRGGHASATVFIRPETPREIPALGQLITLQEPGTVPAVRFHGTPGVTYRIDGSATMLPGSWRTIGVKNARSDGTLDTLDTSAILREKRFYRAVGPSGFARGPGNPAVVGTPAHATISWLPAPGAIGYSVERWSQVDPEQGRASSPQLPATATSWADANYPLEGSYTFQVAAIYPNDHAVAEVSWLRPTPENPADFKVAVVGGGCNVGAILQLSWEPVPGAASYLVSGPGLTGLVPVTGTTVETGLVQDGFKTWQVSSVYEPGAIASAGAQTTTNVIKPTELYGWADLHTHPMSHLGFGKRIMHGAPDIGSLIPRGTLGIGDGCLLTNKIATTMEEALGNCRATHGGYGLNNLCGNHLRAIVLNRFFDSENEHILPSNPFAGNLIGDHEHGGVEENLQYWPNQTSLIHQQMWWEWIKRAKEVGGLRVMVALTVNNELLARVVDGDSPLDDKTSADLQIDEINSFVGRHSDFMEVAKTSDDLRRIVCADKLAVIIGMEVDNIGNFNQPGADSSQTAVRNELQRLFDKGVRYMFPIHLVDNQFGGTAVYNDMFNFANRLTMGKVYDVEASPDPFVKFRLGEAIDVSGNFWVGFGLGALSPLPYPPATLECFPKPPTIGCWEPFNLTVRLLSADPASVKYDSVLPKSAGHANQLGLTDLGKFAIKEMMRLGMLIDIDHMSDKSAHDTLTIAENTNFLQRPHYPPYPINIGHNGIREAGGRERDASISNVTRVAALGGLFGVGTANAFAAEFVRNFTNVWSAMSSNAVATGTDANGMERLPRATPGLKREGFYHSRDFPMGTTATTGGSLRLWDYPKEGVAHYGMMADFLREVKLRDATVHRNLMKSAEAFAKMWKRAEDGTKQQP